MEYKLTLRAKLIIATAVLASLLEIIDTSIVNVAIPRMMGNLGATQEDISWVVTGYIIANAIVLPISAWLGSQFGRRKYYISCIFAFTVTSVACGLAPNLATLVIFRIFQGFMGGALLPTSQALLQEQFPREQSGTASAIYGMSVMIGPTIGPTLGGFLTDHFNWRAIFNINLPLGLLAAGLAYLYVTNHAPKLTKTGPVHDLNDEERESLSVKKAAKIDSIGLGLLILGIGCLQYVLERGQADEWFDSNAILTCTIMALLSLPAFIWWELRVKHPIINLRLFKDSVVRNGTSLMFMLGFMLYGVMFILPLFMARVLNFDATQTGMSFIPGALLTACCMPLVGKLMQKVDPRWLILWGTSMVVLMLYTMTNYSSMTSEKEVFYTLLIRGAGMGFLFVPINAVVLGPFRGADLGQVAGLLNLLRQVGGSVGIALMDTLLLRTSNQNATDIATNVSVFNPGTQAALMKMGVSDLGHVPVGVLRGISMRMQQQEYILSFTQMMWYVLIIFLLSLIPLYLLKVPKDIDFEAAKSAH